MEVMKKNNDNLNEFKTEIKSEINASSVEVNNRFNKQDEKLVDINNELANIRNKDPHSFFQKRYFDERC